MKRIFTLAVACLLLFTGCGNRNAGAGAKNGAGTQPASVPYSAASSPAVSDSTAANKAGTQKEEDGAPVLENAASHENVRPDNSGDIIEIKEKMFIAQTNDIYLNIEDYLGKTIKYEGFFDEYYDEYSGNTYRYVIRYGPGCCGTDGNAGFEVVWDSGYPAPNDWVEAVGVLEEYEEEGGWKYLRLRLSSLGVLDVRGAEYVAQ